MARRRLVGRLGSHPAAVWAIKHLVSPLDRIVMRFSKGRIPPPSSIAVPTLLLTTPGRRSGVDRTVPLVYVGDGSGYVVANARPAGERINPWVLNLRAAGQARIRRGGRLLEVKAEELDEARVAEWWPALVGAWPVFAEHCAATGDRTVFRLELISQGLGER